MSSARAMKIALVRHALVAMATGASVRVSSTTAGSPTPEANFNGTMTEISPFATELCGLPRRASRMRSRSPSRRLPMRPSSVEYRIVPSGDHRVTPSKSLGSSTTVST